MSSVTGLLKSARQRHKNEDEKGADSKRFKEILAIVRKSSTSRRCRNRDQ